MPRRPPIEGIDAVDATTPEKQLMQSIIDAAKHHGWMIYHTFDSRRSEAGFPDLFLIRPRDGKTLVIETKAQTGRLTHEQRHWLFAFHRAGIPVFVARPSDLDFIVYELLDA